MSEKIRFDIDHHVAQPGGPGFYYTVWPSSEPFGPFDTAALAEEAAIKAVEAAMKDIVTATLGLN